MDDQALRQRVQDLIDSAPIAQTDDQAITRWMQQIRLALLGRGSDARDYTYRLNDISWDILADARQEDTRVQRVVQLLAELRAHIDTGEFGEEQPATW